MYSLEARPPKLPKRHVCVAATEKLRCLTTNMPHIACPWTRRLSQLHSVVAEMDASIESMQVMRQQKLDLKQSDEANHILTRISSIYHRVGRKRVLSDVCAV